MKLGTLSGSVSTPGERYTVMRRIMGCRLNGDTRIDGMDIYASLMIQYHFRTFVNLALLEVTNKSGSAEGPGRTYQM